MSKHRSSTQSKHTRIDRESQNIGRESRKVCYSPGLAQSNLPTNAKNKVKGGFTEIEVKRRLRNTRISNFQNFDLDWNTF